MSSISIDIIIGAILIYGIVRGFSRGLFLEISSLISLIAGIYIASKFYNIVAKYFQNSSNHPTPDRHSAVECLWRQWNRPPLLPL